MRYTASVPMNYGTPAVPPSIGPMWTVLQAPGSGSRQAEATPVSESLEWQEEITVHVDTGSCQGVEVERADFTTTVTGKSASSVPLLRPATRGYTQAMFRINGALSAYNILAGAGTNAKADVVSVTRKIDHCAGDRVTNMTENTKPALGDLGQLLIDFKDVPLPATPVGLIGARTVPLRFNGYEGPAAVEWNITPIAAR
jgi:hypothetical protein